MKIGQVPLGARVLVPCPRCGDKRSIVFRGASEYRAAKERPCRHCVSEDTAERGVSSWVRDRMNAPLREDMSG